MTGPTVPAGPVRIHVQGLIDRGMTQAAICRTANVSSAYLSSLLYGQFNLGRTQQMSTGAEVAARVLAVQFEESALKQDPLCAPGERFAPVGFRIGRCEDCGQFAPVRTRHGVLVMFAHPRPTSDAQAPDVPALTTAHPDCGTPKGAQRHRREKTELCEPCRWVLRGYDAGYKTAITKASRDARNAIPVELVEGIVAFCRAFVLQPWPPGRPLSRSRALAKRVVQLADAELVADDEAAVA